MTTEQDFHSNGKILITGGCGYIGITLIRNLARDERFADCTIRILDNMQGRNYPALMDLPDAGRFQFIEGDILDPTTVRLALQDITAVIHLAAIARTPVSFDHPAWMEQVNHWGTAHLIEECLNAGVTRFIYASSTAIYGPGGPFIETDPCRPVGPYAQSVKNAEQAVIVATERGLRPTILRLGTVYGLGPSMQFDAVVNRFAYLAGIGQSLAVYGDGQQKRPVIHVHDAGDAFLLCLFQLENTVGKVFNVAEGNISVLDVVEAVRTARPDVSVRYTDQDVLTHLSFEVDNSALHELGYRPTVHFQAGVAELVERFKGLQSVVDRNFNSSLN